MKQKILLRIPLQSINKSYNFPTRLDGEFNEGIYLASRVLWDRFSKSNFVFDHQIDSIVKYWIRSCYRCTPFGAFNSVALVDLSRESTYIDFDSKTKIRRVRLDNEYILDLVSYLLNEKNLKNKCKYYKNNGIYEVPGFYRYMYFENIGGKREYRLESIKKTSPIKSVLKKLQNTCYTLKELKSELLHIYEYDESEIDLFLNNLVDSQFIVSDLEPNLTGGCQLQILISKLEELDDTSDIVSRLTEVRNLLSFVTNINDYKNIEDKLKTLFSRTVNFHADFYIDNEVFINRDVVSSLQDQLYELKNLFIENNSPSLEKLKKAFIAKFENQIIPLNVLFDPDYGLNDGQYYEVTKTDIHNTHIRKFVLEKYISTLNNDLDVVELNPIDLKELRIPKNEDELNSSLTILGNLMKKGTEFDKDNFVFNLIACSESSLTKFLGRYTQTSSSIENYTRQCITSEDEKEDVIYCEIVHNPGDHVSNVLNRTCVRSHEIICYGKSGIEEKYHLKLDDIFVGISGGRIYLRSKSLNKIIKPKLSNSHNFVQNSLPPIYRFLCDVMMQDYSKTLVWSWEGLVLKHYPRVSYKNIILSPAYWRLSKEDLSEVNFDDSEQITSFRLEYKIPNLILYRQGDNRILIDFNFEAGKNLFISVLNKYKFCEFEECLFKGENCIVYNELGEPFTNEIAFAIPARFPSKRIDHDIPEINKFNTAKKLYPGGKCFYVKLYCGPNYGNDIIKRVCKFLTKYDDKISKFFFIRYKDPEYHLRFRIFFREEYYHEFEVAFSKFYKHLVEKNIIQSVTIDTYIREVERYGKEILTIEDLFHLDSVLVSRTLHNENGNLGDIENIRIALNYIHFAFNDWDVSLSERIHLLEKVKPFDLNLTKTLNRKYREIQNQILEIVELYDPAKINFFFNERSRNADTLIKKIKSSKPDNTKLLLDLCHLFINRLVPIDPLKIESWAYYFLHKAYKSKQAIITSKLR